MFGAGRDAYDFTVTPGNSYGQVLALLDGQTPWEMVLELGCHSGVFSTHVQELGYRVVGVDHDDKAIATARAAGLEAFVVDLENPSWTDILEGRLFDVVLAMDVLEHLRRPDEVLRQLHDLLAVGGAVIVSIPNVSHGSVRLQLLQGSWSYEDAGILDRSHLRFFTLDSMAEMFVEAGYMLETIQRVIVPINGTRIPFDRQLAPIARQMAASPDTQTIQYVLRAVPRSSDTDAADFPALSEALAVNQAFDARSLARAVEAACVDDGRPTSSADPAVIEADVERLQLAEQLRSREHRIADLQRRCEQLTSERDQLRSRKVVRLANQVGAIRRRLLHRQ